MVNPINALKSFLKESKNLSTDSSYKASKEFKNLLKKNEAFGVEVETPNKIMADPATKAKLKSNTSPSSSDIIAIRGEGNQVLMVPNPKRGYGGFQSMSLQFGSLFGTNAESMEKWTKEERSRFKAVSGENYPEDGKRYSINRNKKYDRMGVDSPAVGILNDDGSITIKEYGQLRFGVGDNFEDLSGSATGKVTKSTETAKRTLVKEKQKVETKPAKAQEEAIRKAEEDAYPKGSNTQEQQAEDEVETKSTQAREQTEDTQSEKNTEAQQTAVQQAEKDKIENQKQLVRNDNRESSDIKNDNTTQEQEQQNPSDNPNQTNPDRLNEREKQTSPAENTDPDEESFFSKHKKAILGLGGIGAAAMVAHNSFGGAMSNNELYSDPLDQ